MFLKQEVLVTPDECLSLLHLAQGTYAIENNLITKDSSSFDYSSVFSFNKGEWYYNIVQRIYSTIDVELVAKNVKVKVIKCDTGNFLTKHADNWNSKLNRHYTSVISLNDSYQGGNLIVYENDSKYSSLKSTTGNVGVFYANKLHEVTKVNSGTRYTAITWLYHGDFNLTKSLL